MDILSSILQPSELLALLQFKLHSFVNVNTHRENHTESFRKCYEFLNKTSKSFAVVIEALDDELRHPVCIFYLVLRALDTVEDDMSIPPDDKIQMLKKFHKNLYDPQWNFTNSTEKDKIVLEQFPVISSEFRKLPGVYQNVIAETCEKMGEGMTHYLYKAPLTLQEWDEYCHYAAGFVGIGLIKLFTVSGLEQDDVRNNTVLSNSFGLFLQKVNIIRDYLEDVDQQREFWPKEVWMKYCVHLAELKEPSKHNDAVSCLNELITNTLLHIPDCIECIGKLRNQSVFNFCAVPMTIAVSTLEHCYNNHKVFTGEVKLRKGEAVKLMMGCRNIEKTKAIIAACVQKIQLRIPEKDPSAVQTMKATKSVLKACNTDTSVAASDNIYIYLYLSLGLLIFAAIFL